jgi:hypothetical protein
MNVLNEPIKITVVSIIFIVVINKQVNEQQHKISMHLGDIYGNIYFSCIDINKTDYLSIALIVYKHTPLSLNWDDPSRNKILLWLSKQSVVTVCQFWH